MEDVADGSKGATWIYGGREDGDVGSLAARRVAEVDRSEAVVVEMLSPYGGTRRHGGVHLWP